MTWGRDGSKLVKNSVTYFMDGPQEALVSHGRPHEFLGGGSATFLVVGTGSKRVPISENKTKLLKVLMLIYFKFVTITSIAS